MSTMAHSFSISESNELQNICRKMRIYLMVVALTGFGQLLFPACVLPLRLAATLVLITVVWHIAVVFLSARGENLPSRLQLD